MATLYKEKPLISVVIPVYNGASYIGATLENVMRQTHPTVECVVVDDGSSDNTAEIVAQVSGVRLIRQPNRGVAAARNAGARMAGGAYLAFLDHDDLWRENRLEVMWRRSVETDASVIVSGVQHVADNLKPLGPPRYLSSDHSFPLGLLLFDGRTSGISVASAGLFRRDAFERLGGFDEAFGHSADRELLVRSFLGASVESVPDPLTFYRVRPGSMTSNVDEMEADLRRLLAKHLETVCPPGSPVRASAVRANLDVMLAGSYAGVSNRRRALTLLGHSIREDPATFRTRTWDAMRARAGRFTRPDGA